MGKPYAKEGPSAEDKALDLFADMMIERIQSLSGKDGWKKPWFTEGALQWPKNLNGREYNGMNAMMLLLHCEKEGYKIPRFCTFDRIQQFNKTGKKDEEQKPRVSVLKGEHSFPVMLTTFTVVNKETKEHIKWEDYKLLSQEEREKYNVYPKLQTYHVFNVAQTNLKEVRPEFWEKLEQEYSMPKVEKDEQFAFEPVDRMIADNRWICPIKPMFGDSAYFSISKNEIVMPEKRQFKDGESFYSNLFHEMGHSMHSYYTRNTQPYTYGDHSIFTAEVASTVNESLLIKHLLATEKDENMRKYLLNYYIEEFRTTLFRQTMFAEFELLAHEEIEKGGVLTAGWLNDTYNKLNDLYFGPAMEDDGYIKYEWSRIPHFYRGFYVYQYATGYSAATAISAKILEEGETARENYIKFLKSGSSDYPVELLKIAGVDMASPQPVKMAMETFKNLVDELEKML